MDTTTVDVARTVAEWASGRPGVARVFEKHNVDLCHDGNKTIVEVCRERGIGPQQLVDEFAEAMQPTYCEMGSDWEHASIGELCDHIEAVHHLHLRRELPRLSALLQKVIEIHGAAHPELEELQHSFERFRAALERHMRTETTVVMPALRAMEKNCLPADSGPDYLAHLITRLENDHVVVDEELLQIRRLTNGYASPPNTCAAYGAMLDGLWQLEWHLHQAVQEEDEILFPRAVRHHAMLRSELRGK
jgi:regulator of cell morphogenesis and NO signaling